MTYTLYKTNKTIYQDGIDTNAKIKILQLTNDSMVLKVSGSSSYNRGNYGRNLYSQAYYMVLKVNKITRFGSDAYKIYCAQIGKDILVKCDYNEFIEGVLTSLEDMISG